MFVQNREPWASVHHGIDGHPVVRLCGDYDIANADDLGRALQTAWEGRPARIVIDLSEATFMDASAAARITSFCRHVLLQDIGNSGMSRDMGDTDWSDYVSWPERWHRWMCACWQRLVASWRA